MDMKWDFYEDLQFFTSGATAFWLSILIFGLALFPFAAKYNYVFVANYMAINLIVMVGLRTWKAFRLLFHKFLLTPKHMRQTSRQQIRSRRASGEVSFLFALISFRVCFTSTITGKGTISEVVDAIPIFFR